MGNILQNLKARFNAKKWNLSTEQIDPNRKPDECVSGLWLFDGKLYYGHPLLVSFLSAQNNWFKYKKASKKYKIIN